MISCEEENSIPIILHSEPLELINEKMTKRRIDEVHDGGYSGLIAEHYNKIQDAGLEQRNESKIICMRSFNNWIKSLIVNEFVALARENCHANPTSIKVLDVGCGKGGDLRKYIATDIQHLVCTGKWR